VESCIVREGMEGTRGGEMRRKSAFSMVCGVCVFVNKVMN
jgi:hypothetical protein